MKSKGLQITFLRCVKFPIEEILPWSPGCYYMLHEKEAAVPDLRAMACYTMVYFLRYCAACLEPFDF